MSARIASSGVFLPRNKVSSGEMDVELPSYVESMQEFFSGVENRHICDESETGVYMGAHAARQAMSLGGYSPDDIDLVVSYSMFTDYVVPRDVNFMAKALTISKAACYHLDTTCASFVSMLNVVDALIASGRHKRALLILSTNWFHRGFDNSRDHRCLGDGAAALIIEASETPSLISLAEKTDSAYADHITMCSPILTKKQEFVNFKRGASPEEYFAVGMELTRNLMVQNRIFPNDVTWFICHQPGVRMIQKWCDMLEIPMSKNLNTVAQTGNISAANIPYIIHHYTQVEPRIKRGDTLLFFSPGGGMHYGAVLWKY